MSRLMDEAEAIATLSALAQPTRLRAYRLLVRHEPDGLPAGEVARSLEVPHNTMSAHLAILSQASLVLAERRSQSIIYRANLVHLRELTLHLVRDCCGGRPELCQPLVADLLPCCEG